MADTFAWVNPNKWASCTRYAVRVIGERGSRYEVMALEPCWLDGRNRRLQRGETAFVSKAAVKWMSAASSAQWDNTERLLSAASMLRLEAKELQKLAAELKEQCLSKSGKADYDTTSSNLLPDINGQNLTD